MSGVTCQRLHLATAPLIAVSACLHKIRTRNQSAKRKQEGAPEVPSFLYPLRFSMKVTIDQPTPNEWVVADNESLTHYYVALYPARFQHQLVIAELGNRGKDHYEFEREVYSCTFFDQAPLKFAEFLVVRFTMCQNRDFPVELAYDYGGDLPGQVIKSPNLHEGALQ